MQSKQWNEVILFACEMPLEANSLTKSRSGPAGKDPRLRGDDEKGRGEDEPQERPLDTWPLGLSVHGHL